jgi:hypothetical protein
MQANQLPRQLQAKEDKTTKEPIERKNLTTNKF